MWSDAGPAAGPRRLPIGPSGTGCDLRTRSPVRGGWAGHAARVRTMSTPRRILHVRNGRTRSFELHVGLHRASLLVRRDTTGTAELLPYPARNIGSRWNEPFREGVPERLPARHGRHRILPDSRPLEPVSPSANLCRHGCRRGRASGHRDIIDEGFVRYPMVHVHGRQRLELRHDDRPGSAGVPPAVGRGPADAYFPYFSQ